MNEEATAPEHQPQAITEREWRQIVNSAIDTAIISADRQGRITSWNEGACRILGWSEAEMLGESLARLFTDEDGKAGRIESEIADAVAHGRGGGDEGWRLTKHGDRIWAVGEMTPIRDDAGEVIGFVKILRDRTAQRRAEEAIREETRALELLNRASSALAGETDLHRLVQLVTDTGVALTGQSLELFSITC